MSIPFTGCVIESLATALIGRLARGRIGIPFETFTKVCTAGGAVLA